MKALLKKTGKTDDNWVFAKSVNELADKKTSMVRIANKQIALFEISEGIKACDNRCPHEGYPLSEGSLSDGCVLTCNWHNWKFDLTTGKSLYGGDQLRTYPVEIRGDEIWIDMTELPFDDRYAIIVRNLHDAFDDHAYDRIAREIARLIHLGGDPLDTLRLAISWSWNRLEFGWTHAYAGMANWLTLYHRHTDDDELQLVCLVESVAHTAFDVLREREYPYTDTTRSFNETEFLDAIENEDEIAAIAMIRGGLADGLKFNDFESALTRAALEHYNDFGHSLIYVTHAAELIAHMGDGVAEPLLLSLTRSLIFAPREDKIPEFRKYHNALNNWGHNHETEPLAENWHKKGINSALDTTLKCSGADPEAIFNELLIANATNLLNFNIAQQDKIHVSVSGNVGWLDFTHGVTFATAVRKQCTRYPDLWPQGLLQLACFSGRNAASTEDQPDIESWKSTDPDKTIAQIIQQVFNHGQGEYIVSVHWLKTTLAVQEEVNRLPESKGEILLAALNRFIHSPLRRRQVRRTAYQSQTFVRKT